METQSAEVAQERDPLTLPTTLSICIVFETSAGTLGLLANTRTQPPVLRCAIFDAAEIPSLATTHAVHVPASARSWSLV